MTREQRVHVTNNDVECGVIIAAILLAIVGGAMASSIAERLENIERAIRNEPRVENAK